MRNDALRTGSLSAADRKKLLIAQGALFRSEIIASKEAVEAGLRPEALAKGALHRLGLAASAAFGGGAIAGADGANLRALLPLAISGISFLSKRRALKPVLRGALALGAAAAIASFAFKWKNARRSEAKHAR